MQLNCYSIYDSKAEAFVQPFFSPTNGMAIRSFTSAANDPNTDIHRYAGDYTLFLIGSFEPTNAKLEPEKTPINLGLAQQYLEPHLNPPFPVDPEKISTSTLREAVQATDLPS